MNKKDNNKMLEHVGIPANNCDSWVLFEIESVTGHIPLNLPRHSMFIMNRHSQRVVYMGEVKSLNKVDEIEIFVLKAIWENQTVPHEIYVPRKLKPLVQAINYPKENGEITIRSPRGACARPEEAFRYFVINEALKMGRDFFYWDDLRIAVKTWNQMIDRHPSNQKGE